MEATTVDVVAEIPKAEQGSGAKNSHTSTAESGCKKPLVVAVVAAAAATAAADGNSSTGSSPTSVLPSQRKKNRVQVSNNKKPFVFYLNIAKKYLKLYNDVELSALGMAIPTVVTIAEILKRNGHATEKRITISTVISPKENEMGRQIEKAKIEIVLETVEKFDKTSSVDVATVLKDSDKGASSAA